MIELPPNAIADSERLADWAELSLLIDKPHLLSKDDIADVLLDSGMAAESEPSADHEFADDIVNSLWGVLEDRVRRYGAAYPFQVDAGFSKVKGKGKGWQDWCVFTCLLIQDLGHWYDGVPTTYKPRSSFSDLFEHIVAAAQLGIFRGRSVVFQAKGGNGWSSAINERVKQLAECFVRPIGTLEDLEPNDKDVGLDVVTRMRIFDETPGTIVLLTQCATGANWKDKTGDPPLQTWQTLINWKSPLVKALAIPFTLRPGAPGLSANANDRPAALSRYSDRHSAVILDRPRLVAGHPDLFFDRKHRQRVLNWCRWRIPKFGRL